VWRVRGGRAQVGRPVPGVRVGLIATLGFGVWGALFAIATRAYSWDVMILLLRATSFVIIGAYVLVRGIDLRVFRDRRAAALATTVGILDTLANVLFGLGVQTGFASIAATGTGMYPVVPAILASSPCASGSRRISTRGSEYWCSGSSRSVR